MPTVSISPVGGVAAQFFDNNGVILSGGKLYTYQAGTTTNQATYTSSSGSIAHTNPIVLDSAGRVPGGEIWLVVDLSYKFVLKTSAEVTIGTYDNVTGINGTGITSNASSVAYDPAGTGAVTRTVQAKLRDVISTSDYSSFLNAVNAAVGKTLLVNSAVVIGSNLTVPSTVNVVVEPPGQFSVDGGQTLTIVGELQAGAFRIFYGAGSVVFGTTSRSISPKIWFGTLGAVFNTARTLLQSPTEVGGPVHAYEDDNTLNFTNPTAPNFNAYAAFDANTIITGTAGYDHYVGFQARSTYSGSGSIWDRWDHFNSYPTMNGSGTVANLRHFRAENPGGSGGTVSFQAGFYTEKLVRGTENYGFFMKTPQNAVRTEAGEFAGIILQGNGQVGGFGFALQSRANSNGMILNTANAPIEIGTNNALHSIITANGNWRLGSLTDVLSDANRLEVSGLQGIGARSTGGAGSPCYLSWNNAATGDNVFHQFYTEASTPLLRGSIDYDRGAGQVRYNTTSDGTLKNIIGDASLDRSLEILNSTKLREYSWKNDATNKTQIGVIAQELHETFAGAVSVGGEYKEVIDGEAVTKYRPWAVDKTAFTFHLIAGFQHQQKEIEELKAQVAALAARLDQQPNS